jgi:serine/threonine-protein kinase
LVYNRGDGLVAVPFDPDRLEVTGKPVLIAPDVAWSFSFATTNASLATDGTIAYIPGGEMLPRKAAVWTDRAGTRTPINMDVRFYNGVRASADGTRLLLWDQAANDMLLIYDIARQSLTRVPLRGNVNGFAWTLDGKSVVTVLGRHVVVAPIDGSGQFKAIDRDDVPKLAPDISPDGDTVVASVARPGNGWDLWAFSLKGLPPRPILETRFNERLARYSPNGRWLAYQSDSTGTQEIYVRPVHGDTTTQVSTGGGTIPVWSKDSRELFFKLGEDILVAPVADGAEFSAGAPRRLFKAQTAQVGLDVMPGGQRLVILEAQPAPLPTQINLILGALGRPDSSGTAPR